MIYVIQLIFPYRGVSLSFFGSLDGAAGVLFCTGRRFERPPRLELSLFGGLGSEPSSEITTRLAAPSPKELEATPSIP